MCGIFACMGVVNAGKTIYQGLIDLEYRGYDSWGIAVSTKSGLHLAKDIGFLPSSAPQLPTATCGIGHTRWATHGGVTRDNSHPHLDCSGNVAVVHNGIIENWQEIKQSLLTHNFRSKTDTEIIAHFLGDQLKKGRSLLESAQNLVGKITGYNAFVAIDHSSSTTIAYRKGSPLTLGRHGNKYYLSSDLPTLRPHVDQYYPMHDQDFVVFRSGSCMLIHGGSSVNIPWTQSSGLISKARKLTTKYHMESEIIETINLFPANSNKIISQLPKLSKIISSSSSIIIVGCGSAYYASLLGQFIFRKHGYLTSAVVASDGESTLHTVSDKTLVVAVSQSGETIDTLEYIRSCKGRGAKIIAITNVPDSTLDRTADNSIHLGTGIEVAVASTKAFFYMLFVFLEIFSNSQNHSYQELLQSSLKQLISPSSRSIYRDIARKLSSLEHLFILGKGSLYPVALEFALKLKEVGYLHAEGIPVGELKHGPLALITKGSVCLALSDTCSQVDVATATSEIEARGGKVIVIDSPELGVMSALYHTSLAHLISFELSLLRKINPDRPRNLAKSVTVK